MPLKKKALATEEGSSKKKTQKKKKDPNAPKKAMSGFMYFSQMERDVSSFFSPFVWLHFTLGSVLINSIIFTEQNIKKSNPGIGFGDIGKVLGDKWRQMSGKIFP